MNQIENHTELPKSGANNGFSTRARIKNFISKSLKFVVS